LLESVWINERGVDAIKCRSDNPRRLVRSWHGVILETEPLSLGATASVETLLLLVDDIGRGQVRLAPEARLRADGLGLTPKGNLRLESSSPWSRNRRQDPTCSFVARISGPGTSRAKLYEDSFDVAGRNAAILPPAPSLRGGKLRQERLTRHSSVRERRNGQRSRADFVAGK
jgi:hypothetical protein